MEKRGEEDRERRQREGDERRGRRKMRERGEEEKRALTEMAGAIHTLWTVMRLPHSPAFCSAQTHHPKNPSVHKSPRTALSHGEGDTGEWDKIHATHTIIANNQTRKNRAKLLVMSATLAAAIFHVSVSL